MHGLARNLNINLTNKFHWCSHYPETGEWEQAMHATTTDRAGRQGMAGWPALRIRTLLVLMAINVIEGIDNQLFAVSLPAISHDWSVAPGDLAPALTATMAGAAVATPLGGWLGDCLGRKRTIIGGVVLFALGTILTALPDGNAGMIACRLLTGLGLGACLPPILAFATEAVEPHQRGTAVALTMFSLPLGLSISGVLGPVLLGWIDWRPTFVLCGLVALALAGLAALLLREPPAASRAEDKAVDALSLRSEIDERRRLFACVLAVIFLVYVVVTIGLSWLPSVLNSLGYALGAAAGVTAAWSFAGMAGTLASGWIADRQGPARALRIILAALVVVLAGVMALTAGAGQGGLPPSAMLIVSGGCVGLLVNAAITATYGLTAAGFSAQARARVIGIVSFTGKIGGIGAAAAGPAIFLIGSVAGVFALLLGVAAMAALAAFALPRQLS